MRLDRSWGANTLENDERACDTRRPRRKGLLAVVGLGIALFVSGFVITVASLSGPSAASSGEQVLESPSGYSVSLLVGLLVSLGGVVLATAGPLLLFVVAPASEAQGRLE